MTDPGTASLAAQMTRQGLVKPSIEGGVVDTRLTLGDLAMVTLPDNNWTIIGSGGTVTYFPPGPLSAGEGSPNGVPGGLWYFTMGAGTSGQQRGLRTKVFGRAVGLMYRNYTPPSIDIPSIAVCIDGKVYPVPRQATYFDAQPQAVVTAFGGITAVLVDGDLEDRGHTVDVIVTGNPTNNNRLLLYGFYLDKRYYKDSQRSLTTLAPVQVPVAPTAAAAISLAAAALSTPSAQAGGDRTFRFVDHLLFRDTSNTGGDVVIFRNAVEIDRVKVPADEGTQWPRRGTTHPLAIDGAYTVQVPTGGPATINMTVVGGK